MVQRGLVMVKSQKSEKIVFLLLVLFQISCIENNDPIKEKENLKNVRFRVKNEANSFLCEYNVNFRSDGFCQIEIKTDYLMDSIISIEKKIINNDNRDLENIMDLKDSLTITIEEFQIVEKEELKTLNKIFDFLNFNSVVHLGDFMEDASVYEVYYENKKRIQVYNLKDSDIVAYFFKLTEKYFEVSC